MEISKIESHEGFVLDNFMSLTKLCHTLKEVRQEIYQVIDRLLRV